VKPRLIYSMSVSVDGFIADREGAFGWTVPSDELWEHGSRNQDRVVRSGRRACSGHPRSLLQGG